jgi:hypothetical protein
MRTKTLLLTAALAAAGAATSMAQVYSVNMVGYINVSLPKGFSLIANQLNATPDNKVTTLIPAPPNNTQAYKFNPGSGTYGTMVYVTGIGWDDGGSGDINMTANPGEGVFIYIDPAEAPSGSAVTFVGEVQLTSSVPVGTGFTIVSSALPQSLPLDGAPPAGLGFPIADGDQIYRFSNASGTYSFDEYIGGLGWSGDGGGTPPSPNVGEAFFVNRTTAAAGSWNRTFTVGP